MEHSIKIQKQYFDSMLKLQKTFEIRKNDRNYQINDTLILKEIDENKVYTGRELIVKVTYIYKSPIHGLKLGYCIMAVRPCV